MSQLALYELIAFILGLLFGSFLNVCIVRLPRRQSLLQPRSRCLRCHHTIHWYDNLPLLSFLLLRGRCRHCKTRIPLRYPLVELATALWFVAAIRPLLQVPAVTPTLVLQALAVATLGFLLLGLLVMDWQTQRLPDAFTITGIALGFFLLCGQTIFLNPGQGQILLPAEHMRLRGPGAGTVEGNVFMTGPEAIVLGRLFAIIGAAVLLLAVRALYRRLRGREGMGLGDVKLLAMIAAFLGFTQSLLALFLGIVTAAIFALILLVRGRASLTTRLPFGSFLCAGGLAAALFGPGLLAWYSGLFR